MLKKKITPSFKIFKIETNDGLEIYDYSVKNSKSIIIDLDRKTRLLGKSVYNHYDYDIRSLKLKPIRLPYKPCIIIRFNNGYYDHYDANIIFSIYFGTRIGAFLYNTNLQSQTLDYTCGEWLLDLQHIKYPKTNEQLVKSSIEIMNGFWQSSFDHFNYKNNKIKTIQKRPTAIDYITKGYHLARHFY